MESLLNVNQVAFILKVHALTVRRYIREQKLKAVKVGGSVRVREADVSSFTMDYAPHAQEKSHETKFRFRAREFTDADPFLRLEGRGASVQFGK